MELHYVRELIIVEDKLAQAALSLEAQDNDTQAIPGSNQTIGVIREDCVVVNCAGSCDCFCAFDMLDCCERSDMMVLGFWSRRQTYPAMNDATIASFLV